MYLIFHKSAWNCFPFLLSVLHKTFWGAAVLDLCLICFQLKKTVEELNDALATKEEIAQRCRELDLQVGFVWITASGFRLFTASTVYIYSSTTTYYNKVVNNFSPFLITYFFSADILVTL